MKAVITSSINLMHSPHHIECLRVFDRPPPPRVGLEIVQLLLKDKIPAIFHRGKPVPRGIAQQCLLDVLPHCVGILSLCRHKDKVRVGGYNCLHAEIVEQAVIVVRNIDTAQIRKHLAPDISIAALCPDARCTRAQKHNLRRFLSSRFL